jgi:hypothetical protein
MFGTGVGESRAFLSRGYRIKSLRPRLFIIILPFGTTAATGAAISEYLRAHKAAGYAHKVEIRGVP